MSATIPSREGPSGTVTKLDGDGRRAEQAGRRAVGDGQKDVPAGGGSIQLDGDLDLQLRGSGIGPLDCAHIHQGQGIARDADRSDQTGLGGGGHKSITTSGTYTYVVATTCNWKLMVGSTPPTFAATTASSVPSVMNPTFNCSHRL